METRIAKNWYMVLIKGLIMILLAILVLNHPGETLLGIAVYLGIGLLLTGIMLIGLGIAERKVNQNWGWRTFEGAIDLVLGYMVIANPALTMALIPFMIGFWAILQGILLIISAFSGQGSMGLKLIAGIIICILAQMLMFNPLFMGLTMVIWFGIILLVNGISNVIFSFSLKKMN